MTAMTTGSLEMPMPWLYTLALALAACSTPTLALAAKDATTWGHWGKCFYLLYGDAKGDLQADTRACDEKIGDQKSHGTAKFNTCMQRRGWHVQCNWPSDKRMPGDTEREFDTPVGPCGSIVC
jgi:hypothetical protein